MMEETEAWIETIFNDSETEDVGEYISEMIHDVIDVHGLGMVSAIAFLDEEEKAFQPVFFDTLAGLALDLEEMVFPVATESHQFHDVKRALDYAKQSGKFDSCMPRDSSTKSLAKNFLTMDLPTKNYLFVLVHASVGSSMLSSLNVKDVMLGKDPVLSREVLNILNFERKSAPTSMNDVFKRFRRCFDDEGLGRSDQMVLMESFLRLRMEVQQLPDEKWEEVERRGAMNQSHHSKRRYFNTVSHKTNAMVAATVLCAGSFIYRLTRSKVDYGDFKSVASLMYRNTMDLLCKSVGTKVLKMKYYDESAPENLRNSFHSGLGTMIAKANSSSAYTDDISVLVLLDDDVEDLREFMCLFGCDSDQDCL